MTNKIFWGVETVIFHMLLNVFDETQLKVKAFVKIVSWVCNYFIELRAYVE